MPRWLTPRCWLFLGLALGAVAQAGLIQRDGWVTAWRFWHLDARTPHFSDLRVITGAGDSLERGFDPREKNPGAPFGQRFNQTGLWLQLRHLGLHEADSTAVGLVLLAGYVLGLWWLSAGVGSCEALLVGTLVFSPATLLAVERGSTDLSVFFCLALAGHLAASAPRGAFTAVLVGFWLKLFPLAGIVVFLRVPRRRALRLGLSALGLAAVFCALNFRELVDIAYKTEKGRDTSYGWSVLSLYLGQFPGWAAAIAWPVRWVGGGLAAAGLAAAWWRGNRAADATPPGRALDFFRIGAGVYAGTFLLGASWDYRLIFGLFMVPQLAAWMRDDDPVLRRTAVAVLAALFLSAWSLALHGWFDGVLVGRIIARTMEELAKWGLFVGCVYLLARTLPAWLKISGPSSPAAAPAPAKP
jgi:hypothetical protein